MEGVDKFTEKLHQLLEPKNADPESSVKFYDEEAEKYDEIIEALGSVGPSIVAQKLSELVPDAKKKDFKILDVAAGTGRVGTELDKRGFNNIDALEPSEEMLEVLKKKGNYNRIFCQFFAGGTEFAVEDGHYDGIVINGAFVKGHLPVDALREIARILKPGGLFVTNNTHEVHSEEYDAAVEGEMKKMEEEKVWVMLSKEDCANRKDVQSSLYAFKKL